MRQKTYDVLVIGGGIQGLSTAYWLALQKNLSVGLIEQFEIGHKKGSSHGTSRVLRCAYDHLDLMKMMFMIYQDLWPRFEKELATQLFFPNPYCAFGSDSTFMKYLTTCDQVSTNIERLSPHRAAKIFPHFRFDQVSDVIVDYSAGVLAASTIIENLLQYCSNRGVDIIQKTKVLGLDFNEKIPMVKTNQGVYSAHKVILTMGAWITKLMPGLEKLFSTIRQTVCYVKLEGNRGWGIGEFPNWSYFGENEIYYGVPEFGCEGIKIAQHETQGRSDDPDVFVEKGSPQQIETIKNFISQHFVDSLQEVISSETCFYTSTAKELFLLDFYPDDPRIIIGSACSGHGFKFAPLVGKVLAELALNETSGPDFEPIRKRLFLFPSR